MKVLIDGVRPTEKKWLGECKVCEAVVEANSTELDIKSSQRDGEWAWKEKCPYCKQKDKFGMICFHREDDPICKRLILRIKKNGIDERGE